ncbi:hypothetical protein F4604DRAFT_1679395 [Suillus subluteus]|nr:hypothetical protein F4604DRAFT_1679395 [Suillus subluteus]
MTNNVFSLNLLQQSSSSSSAPASANSQNISSAHSVWSQQATWLPTPSSQLPVSSTCHNPSPAASSSGAAGSSSNSAAAHSTSGNSTPSSCPSGSSQATIVQPNSGPPANNTQSSSVPTQNQASSVCPGPPNVAQPVPTSQRWLAERAALQARLCKLDAEDANILVPPVNTPTAPLPAMFASPAAVDQVKVAAVALHTDSKKISLPDLVVPGFKASPLDAIIPPRVDEALKQYKYVPYIAITPAVHLNAFCGSDEVFSFNSQGSLIAKGINHSKEKMIKFHEWLAASRVVEECITFHHGANRGAVWVTQQK